MKYELKKGTEFSSDVLVATDDNGEMLFIPINEGNSDYQAYLADEAKTK